MIKRAAFLVLAAALAACSGNFGTGTGFPQQGGMPPVNGSPMPGNNPNGYPQSVAQNPNMQGGSPAPMPSAASYSAGDAQNGFVCPTMTDGYACTLAFNLPAPTPEPSPTASGKSKTTPSPSPSPSPTPTPTPDATGSGTPSPSPTPAGATVSLNSQATPANAPKMVHIPDNSLDVVPMMMVTLTTSGGDFPLDGWVKGDFTLPKGQVEDRGFALQLFQQQSKKGKTSVSPIWTFDKSTLNGTTLTFSFKPPKMKIAKNSTYLLVLYGDDKKASPAPSSSASALPSEMPSAAGNELPTPVPSVSPSPVTF